MEVLEEDNEIYSTYLEGGDYEKLLTEKKEREKQEQEERKKLNEQVKEEMQEDLNDIGVGSENIGYGDNKGEDNEEIQKDKEEFMENPLDMVEEIEIESEETEEQKSFNDVNYWKPEVKDDDSMKNILDDLD